MHCSYIVKLTAVAPPFARRLNELSNEVVLLTSKTSALKDEVDKIKKEREGDKKTMEDMTKKIKQYEDERLRKRSINDVTDGAEENLERKCKKRTIIEEY
jgi:hypothetical protein